VFVIHTRIRSQRGLVVQRTRAAAVALFICMSSVKAAPLPDPLARHAAQIGNLHAAVLLDVATAGSAVVAVGSRGTIVVSNDDGRRWYQVPSPVSVTLTTVAFADPKDGWALGHSGVILHTTDSGHSWTKQFDGRAEAKLELESARAALSAAPNDAAGKARLRAADSLVHEGADKPLLSISFSSAQEATVVGAYGLVFHTHDAGATWESWIGRVPNPAGLHLYAVRARGSSIFLAGERGYFARSLDGGRTFERIQTPYAGSYFTMSILPSGRVFIGGLEGQGFSLDVTSMTFEHSKGLDTASLIQSTVGPGGELLAVDQNGTVWASVDDGRNFTRRAPSAPQTLAAAVAVARDGSLVTVGFGGAGVTSVVNSSGSVSQSSAKPAEKGEQR
jgi:photosystem II stability/assembly factor-like uncharacterized protein